MMMAMVHKRWFSLHSEIGWELLVMLIVETGENDQITSGAGNLIILKVEVNTI